MEKFYVTFGMRYRNEPHPVDDRAHPDGWFTVVAEDMAEARSIIWGHLGYAYAFLYDEEHFKKSYHPRGELAIIRKKETDADHG